MTTIPVVYGYPTFDGRYNGETLFDGVTHCLYIWSMDQYTSIYSWKSIAMSGATGPAGPAGKDADTEIVDMLTTKLKYLERMMELFIMERFDKNKYFELKSMLNSEDDETIATAIKIINAQYEKHIKNA